MAKTKGVKMKRLKYGATKDMSPEEYIQYKRNLSKRWRQKHPDRVKAQNRFYSDLYRTIKPFECTCKICGRKFDGARSCLKMCPQCIADWHRKAELARKARVIKQEERQAEYEEIAYWYSKGMTQEVLAEDFGRSQSGISKIVRRFNTCKK